MSDALDEAATNLPARDATALVLQAIRQARGLPPRPIRTAIAHSVTAQE